MSLLTPLKPGKSRESLAWKLRPLTWAPRGPVRLQVKLVSRSESNTTRRVLSTSSVRQWRKAAGADEQRTGDVDAIFRFRFLDMRSDWNWRFSERQELRFGGSAGRADADYDYALVASISDPGAPGGMVDISHAHEVHARGSQWGAHAAWRGRAGR